MLTGNISVSIYMCKFEKIKHSLELLDNPDHHKMMRKELCMNIFPFGNDGADPRLAIKLVRYIIKKFKLYFRLNRHIFQLTTPSCLLDAGIYRLHTVTSILKNFDFEPQLFVNPKFKTIEKEASFYSGTFEGKV